MKYKDQIIDCPDVEYIVFPNKANGKDLVIKVRACLDMTKFDEYCQRPKVPYRTYPGGKSVPDEEDSEYKKDIEEG